MKNPEHLTYNSDLSMFDALPEGAKLTFTEVPPLTAKEKDMSAGFTKVVLEFRDVANELLHCVLAAQSSNSNWNKDGNVAEWTKKANKANQEYTRLCLKYNLI